MLDGSAVEPPRPQARPAENPAVVAEAAEKKAEAVPSVEDQRKAEAQRAENAKLAATIGDLSDVDLAGADMLLQRASGIGVQGWVEQEMRDLEFKMTAEGMTPKQYEEARKHLEMMQKTAEPMAKRLDTYIEKTIDNPKASKGSRSMAYDIKIDLIRQRIASNNEYLATNPKLNQRQIDKIGDVNAGYEKDIKSLEERKKLALGLGQTEAQPTDTIASLAVGVSEASSGKALTEKEKAEIVENPLGYLESVFQQATSDYKDNKKERVERIVQFMQDKNIITDPKALQTFKDRLIGETLEVATKGDERLQKYTSLTKGIMALGGLLAFLAIKQGSGEKEGQGGMMG